LAFVRQDGVAALPSASEIKSSIARDGRTRSSRASKSAGGELSSPANAALDVIRKVIHGENPD
jgi:hypothetical protein